MRTIATLFLVGFAAAPSTALADRAPTKAERTTIERVATRGCEQPPRACTFKKARVSTRNGRYAFATVIGEGISGVLLERNLPRALRFKRIGVQGGGVQECSYWRRRAPRAVLRDLSVRGLDGASGSVRLCG